MYYISDWKIYTDGIRSAIKEALEAGKIQADDTVWQGPSGDAVVAADAAELDEEYGDYTDSGLVSEYLS